MSYEDPSQPSSLRGVSAFVKAQGISREKTERQLQQKVSYMLHKPRRRRPFPYITYLGVWYK